MHREVLKQLLGREQKQKQLTRRLPRLTPKTLHYSISFQIERSCRVRLAANKVVVDGSIPNNISSPPQCAVSSSYCSSGTPGTPSGSPITQCNPGHSPGAGGETVRLQPNTRISLPRSIKHSQGGAVCADSTT